MILQNIKKLNKIAKNNGQLLDPSKNFSFFMLKSFVFMVEFF